MTTHRTLFALLLACMTLLAGCHSQIPMSVSHEISTQRKMQAAQHWDVLASDVADRVARAINDRPDLTDRPIFVKPPDEHAFSQAFTALVTSQLVSRGMQVSVELEDALILEHQVLAVKHHQRLQRPPLGMFTAISAGVWAASAAQYATINEWMMLAMAAGAVADITSGYMAPYSNHEIIITTSFSFRNRYVMHDSAIYYINDPDLCQYAEAMGDCSTPPVPDPDVADPQTRTVSIVSE